MSFLLMFMNAGFDTVSSANEISVGSMLDMTPNEIPKDVQEAMQTQIPALNAYNQFRKNLEQTTNFALEKDVYAGEYISGDKLIVQLVNPSEDDVEIYEGLTEKSNSVVFVEAKYTLTELEQYEEIALLLSDEYDIISFGIDIRRNRVMLTVTEEDYDELVQDELVKQNCDAFYIEIGKYAVPCATSLYGGDRISKSSSSMSSSYMSVCIGGTFNGKAAVLTAGHSNEGSPNYYRNGTLVGSVVYQRCNTTLGNTGTSSLGDFAIIQLNSAFAATNMVRTASSSVQITGVYSSLPVGTTIYKYGSETGYSWGTVTHTSVTVNYPDESLIGTKYQIRGLYQSSIKNSSNTNAIDRGDSGGCVYIKDGNNYKIHGSVSGLYISNSANNIMYSSPIYYAQNIGFVPKTS